VSSILLKRSAMCALSLTAFGVRLAIAADPTRSISTAVTTDDVLFSLRGE